MEEKMEQVFEEVAGMTLERIKQCKDAKHTLLDSDELEMVRITQSLYETLNHANQSVIAAASFPDDKDASKTNCRYTPKPEDVFTPTDSSGTKYSPLSSSTVRPKANHECFQ